MSVEQTTPLHLQVNHHVLNLKINDLTHRVTNFGLGSHKNIIKCLGALVAVIQPWFMIIIGKAFNTGMIHCLKSLSYFSRSCTMKPQETRTSYC